MKLDDVKVILSMDLLLVGLELFVALFPPCKRRKLPSNENHRRSISVQVHFNTNLGQVKEHFKSKSSSIEVDFRGSIEFDFRFSFMFILDSHSVHFRFIFIFQSASNFSSSPCKRRKFGATRITGGISQRLFVYQTGQQLHIC